MGRSGDAFEEGRGASILYGEVHIFLDFVSECRYVCEMNDAVVLCIGDGKGERAVSIFHGYDWNHDVVCPCVHLLVVGMIPFVIEDGLAQGHCGIDQLTLMIDCFSNNQHHIMMWIRGKGEGYSF